MILEPSSLDELCEAVRGSPFVVPIGAGTKPALSAVPDRFERISLKRLSGIVEYEPTEFTITALAGTPLSEIQKELARHGQHLPFDPPLGSAGATLGGTVAAGLSGPGAFRFGPIRDFLIGVRFVDGVGRLISGGGRVVKNAAGFDIPKFLIGSAGRFGVLAELTFKVFPKPEATATFGIAARSPAHVKNLLAKLSRSTHDLEALDYEPHAKVIWGRIAGSAEALDVRLKQIELSLDLDSGMALCEPGEAVFFWNRQLDLSWTEADRWLAKLPITPDAIDDLEARLSGLGLSRHYSLGGNVAWIAGTPERWDLLRELNRSAMGLRTPDGASPFVGERFAETALFQNLKQAFDPRGRFPRF